jgi:hypothetical protein
VRAALGLSIHTGWAAAVVAAGDLDAPQIVLREELELLGDPQRFVYHRAAEGPPTDAERSIAAAAREAARRARDALEALQTKAADAGARLVCCSLVAKLTPMPGPLSAVLAAHPKLHTAEACLYRDTLAQAARALALKVEIVPPDRALASATAQQLKRAGAAAGRPWGKDQKLAALAAWMTL